MSKPPADISFHYTQEQMAQDLIALIPSKEGDSFLDAGSGKNKVWFNNLPSPKAECELEDGCDFYTVNGEVDWVVGNPPYHESWKFTEHALTIAQKGIAWLVNNQAMNSHFTPARLAKMGEQGFHYSKIHVVADKRWFGRYYFLLLEKKPGTLISWERKTY